MNLEKKTKQELLFIIDELLQRNTEQDVQLEDLTKEMAQIELRYEQELFESKEHMAAIKEEVDYYKNAGRDEY